MNLDEANQKHAEWKMKFRVAISKKETRDAVTIQGDKNCLLGQWLQGKGYLRYGQNPAFKDVVAKHAIFHCAAGKVATSINAEQYDVAAGVIDGGTEDTQASVAVSLAIMQLKKEMS